MKQHIVSIKPAAAGWPIADYPQIQRARDLYDAGSHELAQGRLEGDRIALYSIPRKVPAKPRRYFHGEVRRLA